MADKKQVQVRLLESVKKMLIDYLEQHQQRKTPERLAILEDIYTHNGHFDVEDIFVHMKAKNYRVSRATLYNTINMFLDAKLIIKHQFGNNSAHYERAFGNKPHDHLVCLNCGDIIEIDTEIEDIAREVADRADFYITHHSLYIYGYCKKCQAKRVANSENNV